MEKIFRFVLSLSYAGTWVIAAVLLLRCLLYRLPKKFSYILWIIPGIRLLFPISFPGIWGMLRNLEAVDSHFMILQTAKAVQDTVTVGEGIDGIRLAEEVFTGIQSESFVSFVLGLIGVFWAVGMGLLAGYGVFSLIRLKRKLQISVRWKENIYLADGILTPFVFIGFPNRIYLPSEFEKEECQYILLHEQFHIKRKDTLFKLFAFLILCIHWFNPAVWIGIYFFSRDMEMSCDEAVTSELDRKGKQEYARALLHFSVNPKQWLRCSANFGEKGVRGRIMNLFQKKSKSKRAIILGTVVVIMAGVILLPDFLGQGSAKTVSGETKAEKNAEGRLGELVKKEGDETNREYGYPTKIYDYSEENSKESFEESHNQKEYADIQLEYLPYPEMKEIDILVFNYPVNAAYCRVSVNLGNTSTSKIYLGKEKQFTYYVPDNFDNIMHDVILFEFYDEYSRFIKDFKIAIEYDKNRKQIQIIDMKKCSDITS